MLDGVGTETYSEMVLLGYPRSAAQRLALQPLWSVTAGAGFREEGCNFDPSCGTSVGNPRIKSEEAPTPRIASGPGLLEPIYCSPYKNNVCFTEILFSKKERKMAVFRRCPED